MTPVQRPSADEAAACLLRASEAAARPVRRRSTKRRIASISVLLAGIVVAGCSGNTNLGATRISATTATLQASFHCQTGETCDGYFRWRTGADGSWNSGSTIGPAGGPVDLDRWTWDAPAGTLAAGTSYEYQWCGRTSPTSSYSCVGPTGEQTPESATSDGDPNLTSKFTTLLPVTTVSAQQFHDSLGVNVKETYFDTIYGNWSQTLSDVRTIGFTHLRVGIYDSSNAGWNARHWGDLRQAVASGLKLDVGINPDCSSQGTKSNPHFPDCFAALRDQVGLSGVESIEWPNEYDISGDPNWAAALRTWGPQIYTLTKQLGPFPVYGPSIVFPSSIAPAGDQSAALDYGNFHDYQGATSSNPQAVALEASRMAPLTGGKPNVATEFGYHNAVWPSDNASQPGIDESGAAVYVLRQYLEHLADGVSRSYVHQLYDLDNSNISSNRFGLIRSDDSFKPAALALKNLITMIGAGAPASISPLVWGVEPGDPTSDLRYLDIEAADGSHDLVLWRTASVWDRVAKQDLAVASETIHVDGDFASWQQGDPLQSATLTGGSGPLVVNLGADPVVLHILPVASGFTGQSKVRSTARDSTTRAAKPRAVPARRPAHSAAVYRGVNRYRDALASGRHTRAPARTGR